MHTKIFVLAGLIAYACSAVASAAAPTNPVALIPMVLIAEQQCGSSLAECATTYGCPIERTPTAAPTTPERGVLSISIWNAHGGTVIIFNQISRFQFRGRFDGTLDAVNDTKMGLGFISAKDLRSDLLAQAQTAYTRDLWILAQCNLSGDALYPV